MGEDNVVIDRYAAHNITMGQQQPANVDSQNRKITPDANSACVSCTEVVASNICGCSYDPNAKECSKNTVSHIFLGVECVLCFSGIAVAALTHAAIQSVGFALTGVCGGLASINLCTHGFLMCCNKKSDQSFGEIECNAQDGITNPSDVVIDQPKRM